MRGGFTRPALTTAGTAALAAVILRDSARLQEEEAEGARRGGWSRHDPPLPLHDVADAERAIAALKPLPLASAHESAAGRRQPASQPSRYAWGPASAPG